MTDKFDPTKYKLVPIEPTLEMRKAWNSAKNNDTSYFSCDFYDAMIAAAPVIDQWNYDMDSAPRNERIMIVVDGHVKIAKFEHYGRNWVVFQCDDNWYQEEYHETYPTAWQPLPAAPQQGE